jgi:hypothetical protein
MKPRLTDWHAQDIFGEDKQKRGAGSFLPFPFLSTG